MGQGASAIEKCLTNAVGGDTSLLVSQNAPLFQESAVKPYNLDVSVKPVAVTFPKTSEHISGIVKCAADNNNIKVQPRCGGHSYANFGIPTDGIVVDLKNFNQFSMDNSTWQATIGGGTLLGDVTQRLHDHGNRAMAHGTCPQVGIGGHATIGGLGPTSRMWGSALDHVEEVEVVLANSSVVRASEKQNSDVFWALKGAGAGFGIITEFKVRTEKEPGESVLYSYNIKVGDTETKAASFKKWLKLVSDPDLSRKFASQFILSEAGVVVYGTFFGSKAEFDSLNLSDQLGENDGSALVFNDWLGMVAHWGEEAGLEIAGGIASHFYAKSFAYSRDDIPSDEAVDKLFEYIDKTDKGTLLWFVIWDLAGGAINDVAPDATAYRHRNTLFYHQSYAVNLFGSVEQKTKDFLNKFNDIISEALPGHNLGAYPGYVDLGLENAQEAYWGDNLPRLKQIKSAVDPKDIFHNPQSVPLK